MRLWLRVALVVAFVSVSALLVTGAVAVNVAASTATREAVWAQERDVGALAATVARWLDDQGDVLLGWALAFPLADLDDARRAGLLKAVLKGVPSTVTVVLVDGDGAPVTEGEWFDLPPEGTGDWVVGSRERADALVRALPLTAALGDPRGVAFGEPMVNGEGPPTLPIAVVASREPPLVLGAEVTLGVAVDLVRATTADRAVVLVDAHGHGVVGEAHELVDLERVVPVLGTLANFSYDVQGRAVRGAVAPVGLAGWSVLVLEPEEVALSGANAIWWRVVPVVAGAMVLSIAVGLVLGRTVTGPLAQLRDTVQALTEGRYGALADVATSDEVGELAAAFNAMSARLRANQEEITRQRDAIEAFNRDLQDRVDEATASLRGAQEQLVRSGQLAAVAQIGAGLAHELNNPLMAVLGLAQVLATQARDPVLAQAASDLVAEAGRCREVVETMLRLAEAEPDDAIGGAVALRALLAEVGAAVGSAVRRRGVELTWAEAPDVRVAVEGTAGVRAVGALIAALAAGLPAGERLDVRTRVDGGTVSLSLCPSRPIDERADDWMASGMDVWVARQRLGQLGMALVEPSGPEASWSVRIPVA